MVKKYQHRSKINYKIDTNYDDTLQPVILFAKWGKITLSYMGETESFKDVIIWPEGYLKWDWTLSDTHHNPGIQTMEVKNLVDKHECELIILSTGFEDVLQVDKKTIAWLKRKRIDYIVANSMEAIKEYNSIIDRRVGLLLH